MMLFQTAKCSRCSRPR